MSFIGDDIGSIVQAMRTDGKTFAPYVGTTAPQPYYMYGHRQEVVNRTTVKANDPIYKAQRFPLIMLRQDTVESVRGDMVDYTLNLAFVAFTDPNLNSEQRVAQVFTPILEPLFKQFFLLFKKRALFSWSGQLQQDKPPHDKILRPYWGTAGTEANIANIFNDPTDAIEIQNLKFSKRSKNCS